MSNYNIFGPKPSTILMCDEIYIKALCPQIAQNVDPALITSAIMVAQDKYILFMLGNNIFENMKLQISGNTLTAPYLKLLTEYLMPALAYGTIVEMLPGLSFQMKNKGTTQSKSEFSETIKRSDIEWLMQQYRNQSFQYFQLGTQFLLNNTQTFPEYLNPNLNSAGNGIDLIYPNMATYFYGIHLPQLGGGSPMREYYGFGMDVNQYLERIQNR